MVSLNMIQNRLSLVKTYVQFLHLTAMSKQVSCLAQVLGEIEDYLPIVTISLSYFKELNLNYNEF